jgi:hypothetical protein
MMRALIAVCAGFYAVLSPAAAQDRFDLRDWTRRAIPDSPTVFYECTVPPVCGRGSAVSGRLQSQRAAPSDIRGERQRQQAMEQRMREQSGGRIVDVRTGETREQPINGLRALVTEKQARLGDGGQQFYIDAVLFGRTRVYSIVASGGDPQQVRRNFEGYARVLALVLDQIAIADRVRTSRPPDRAAPPPSRPPDLPPQQHEPSPAGQTAPPASFPLTPPAANFPPPPAPPR